MIPGEYPNAILFSRRSQVKDSQTNDAPNTQQVQPEYDDGQSTDLEREDIGEDIEEMKPWDPREIRVDPKMFSLRNIIDMIDEGTLKLNPEFQRRRVWKPATKARLIESLLLRIPLPSFYFDSDEHGQMQVVDGLQRLSSVYEFVKEKFPLDGLEYLNKHVGGRNFSDLDQLWQRRIYQTQLAVNVIDPQTPGPVKFNIFKRINTGGQPLNAQEIRHAMSKERSRAFLQQLSEKDIFHQATGSALKNHRRMADLEVVLRYCAFRSLEDLSQYREFNTMSEFLTDFTDKVDSGLLSDRALEILDEDFTFAMNNAYNLFQEEAFRKWPLETPRRNPINRALFESWSVALSDYHWEHLQPHKDQIIAAAREAMTNDTDYIQSISVSTGSGPRVVCRFETARQILNQAQE
ncbi:DUF262 domain-containing protein [Lujinxingia vulgaris]|uniref:DUF262 domain-containing protein n=2 Tax=Lujinxingia vulgaris TaxID=2600176 RepID=A0A5C6XTK9_9DELT|nr:DUF262 domain-containing protein [Lujinxingia vulgaris]